ncbi:MAG TPA: SPOR domain-containing protein [Nitrobacter sp.]|nr:SPOR domain-containing protein [Nitrobacter sp.]
MADRYQNRPFPADDDHGRGDHRASQRAESDPLAELARLIGQTDPFGSQARPRQQPAVSVGHDDRYSDGGYQDETYREPSAADEVGDAIATPPPWVQRMSRQAPPRHDPEPAPEPHPVLRRAAVYPVHAPDDQPAFGHDADLARYDDALYGQPDHANDMPSGGYQDDRYPGDGYAYQDGYGEEMEASPKRRGGMAMVAAVLALAVVGTGAAYAYRTYVHPTRNGAPPIIKADTTPTKIIPQQQSSGDAVGKLIQDRMSASDGTEQIVPREEQPVDVQATAPAPAPAAPRVVFPALNQNANPPTTASVAPNVRPPPTVANGTIPGDEPRKIRTLTVHGDQADASALPVRRAAETAAAPAIAHRAPPQVAAAPSANAPLSLSPQASAAPARVAALAPGPQSIAPAASSGGYVVQVSSQRNEADARASFRALQGKFPSVLGSRSPLIKRADLGARGVYYRAMVGPFGSPEEASHFCGSLKSAGGQCVVQRN